MEVNINENERIDDLQCNGYKIIQNKDGFCFGIDSVLLSEFAKDIKPGNRVVDLGTGSGVLGFLLLGKKNVGNIIGIEIQKEVAEMANKSIKLNDAEEKFKIINDNIKNVISQKLIEKSTVDIIVTNPPYKPINTGIINDNTKKLISRHEISATLEDFIEVSEYLLRDKGILYMVHKPERLVDIVYILRKNKLEPKELRLIYPSKDKDANLVLIKAVKGGNSFLKVDSPLYVYNENGTYTKEILDIYEKNKN